MPQYLYQIAYTSESIAAQIASPEDRLKTAAQPILHAVGGKMLAGGFSFGDWDVALVVEAPDDETVAAISLAVAAGGAIKAQKTTKLLSGDQWIAALGQASDIGKAYQPKK